jgi:hypothetical protein
VDGQLFGWKGFDHLRATKAVGPNFDFRIDGALEAQQFKRENNPLQKKITGPKTAKDHHAIAGIVIAAGCVLQSMTKAEIEPSTHQSPLGLGSKSHGF